MTVARISRLVLGLCFAYGAYELFGAALDEIGGVLGELFAESVIYPANVTEGDPDHGA